MKYDIRINFAIYSIFIVLLTALLLTSSACSFSRFNDFLATLAETTQSSDSSIETTQDISMSSSSFASDESVSSSAEESHSSFIVQFIDVGQGDAALISCDGHYMLVDGGPASASQKIYTILKNDGITYLDYIVASHPDADHVGGLAAALEAAECGTFLSNTTENSEKGYFTDVKKRLAAREQEIVVPQVKEEFQLGTAKFTVVANENAEDNESLVIRVVYGENSFLFTGDAPQSELIENALAIQSDVLKVSHHGSYGETDGTLLSAVMPTYAVISVGADNTYGHPNAAVLNVLEQYAVTTYRTDLCGDIYMTSDGEQITVTTQKNSANISREIVLIPETSEATGEVASEVTNEAQSEVTDDASSDTISRSNSSSTSDVEDVAQSYVVNKNTLKFHYPTCDSATKMKESNKWYFTGTRSELIEQGYVPCKICNP